MPKKKLSSADRQRLTTHLRLAKGQADRSIAATEAARVEYKRARAEYREAKKAAKQARKALKKLLRLKRRTRTGLKTKGPKLVPRVIKASPTQVTPRETPPAA